MTLLHDALLHDAREPSSWRFCLDEGSRPRVMRVVSDIAGDLCRYLVPPSDRTGFPASAHLWNLSCSALFFAYLGAVTGEREHHETSQELLETAIGFLAGAQQIRMCLYYGVAGLGWAVHHVGRMLGNHDPGVTAPLDEELLAFLAGHDPASEPYDLMTGLVGLGIYGFEAGNLPLVHEVVCRLEKLAETTDHGLTWYTPHQGERSGSTDGHYNLGLAHGTAGVVAFLANVIKAEIETSRARFLLDGAVRWLLAQRLPPGEERVFPWMVTPGAEAMTRGLDPGWAYADAGIALALISAAKTIEDESLAREVCVLAESEALSLAQIPVRRPGIGYGPAGYAQIFARLYQQTGMPAFRSASRDAISSLLAMRVPGEPLGGFESAMLSDQPNRPDVGFLAGASGIALVLLAACHELEPGWDRLLLLSPLHLIGRD